MKFISNLVSCRDKSNLIFKGQKGIKKKKVFKGNSNNPSLICLSFLNCDGSLEMMVIMVISCLLN